MKQDQKISRRTLIGGMAVTGAALSLGLRPGRADARFAVERTPAQWLQQLGRERYHILREAGTERPFSSPLNGEHRRGTFRCAGCNQALFSSATKFESHTGWPSFFKPLAGAVVTRPDHSVFMDRTEVLCSRCGGHLGHVFDDGPRPTGLRYCMNGLAMTFAPATA